MQASRKCFARKGKFFLADLMFARKLCYRVASSQLNCVENKAQKLHVSGFAEALLHTHICDAYQLGRCDHSNYLTFCSRRLSARSHFARARTRLIAQIGRIRSLSALSAIDFLTLCATTHHTLTI